MLVDDEKDITSILKPGLEHHGFVVDTFNDPVQAISQYKPNFYDLIVLDIRMPTIDGFKVAKQIWANDERARICFFSAFEIYESEAKKVFQNLKTYCFIKKPVTSATLAKHIEAHFLKV
jgi:DNA-binding response OmpR family regulator